MGSVIRLETFKYIGGCMEICWMHGLMMGIWVMLGEVICFVGGAQLPKNVILALADVVTGRNACQLTWTISI